MLNRKPDNIAYGGQPGDEYLPTDYVTVKNLPTYLQNLRNLLFGSNPDRIFSNYRVRQYLAVLHATELVEFVTELDPRVTYDTDNTDLWSDSVFSITTSANSIHVIGELGSPDAAGRSLHEWDVRILTETTLEVIRHTPPQQHLVQTYEFTDGLSNLLLLPGSAAKFRIRESAGTRWSVRGIARPQKDLGEILHELSSAGASHMNQLFGVGSPTAELEPFKTFRNLWFQHPELSYRLGGLLLAVIYRTEELRTHG